MSTLQEYWDACLIRAWRNHLRVLDAMRMFQSITGKRLDECELLRVPATNIPWLIGMRVFASGHLPKVSDWLWEHEPEKDVALLRKLSKSKYDTEKVRYRTNGDRDLEATQSRVRRDRQKLEFKTREISEKNAATDWNVTKGRTKVRVRK